MEILVRERNVSKYMVLMVMMMVMMLSAVLVMVALSTHKYVLLLMTCHIV